MFKKFIFKIKKYINIFKFMQSNYIGRVDFVNRNMSQI